MTKILLLDQKTGDLNSSMEKLSTKETKLTTTPITSSRKNRHINVNNFEQLLHPRRTSTMVSEISSIGSPRSLQSCALCGIDPSELYAVPYEAFQKKYCHTTIHNAIGDRVSVKLKGSEQKMLATHKFKEYERNRQQKIEKVKKQRNLLLVKESLLPKSTERLNRTKQNFSSVSHESDFQKKIGSSSIPKSTHFGEKRFQNEFFKRKAAAEEKRRHTLERARDITERNEIAALKEQIANEYRRDQNFREQSLSREQKLQDQVSKRAFLRESVEHNLREHLYKQKSIQRECDKSQVIYHSPMFGQTLRDADRQHVKQKSLLRIKVHDAKMAYLTPERRTKS